MPIIEGPNKYGPGPELATATATATARPASPDQF